MKKKLLFFTSGYPYGTVETFIETEIEYISQYFDVTIVAITNTNTLTRKVPQNVTVIRCEHDKKSEHSKLSRLKLLFNKDVLQEIILSFKKNFKINTELLLYYSRAKEIAKFIEEKNLIAQNEKVILYSYWLNEAALAGVFLKRRNPFIKFVSRAHGYDLYVERNKEQLSYFKKMIDKYIDNVFFVSQNGLEYYQKKFAADLNKCKLSYLGVTNKNDFLNENNKNDVLKIVTCSNVTQVKRLDLIIRALSLVENFNVEWIHIGDGEMLGEIKELAYHNLQNKKNVNYKFIGRKSNIEVMNMYKNNGYDLFINTSDSEGLPVTIMECMSFGIPVIARNVGGISEVVNNSNGYLIDKHVADTEIYDTIVKFRNMDSNSIKVIKSNAYNTWKTKFNADMNYMIFALELYKLN